MLPRHWDVPSCERAFRRQRDLGKCPHCCDCPGILWTVWYGGAICKASGRVRLARADRLPPVYYLDDACVRLFLRGSIYPAKARDRVASVYSRMDGDV